MNEEVRSMLGTALREEPPMGVDRSKVLAAGRRRLRLRRAGMAGGAVLGVLAVLATASVITNHLPAGHQDQTRPATEATRAGATEPTAALTPTQSLPPGVACPNRPPGAAPGAASTDDPRRLAEAARLTAAFAGFAFPVPPGVQPPQQIVFCASAGDWRADITLTGPSGQRNLLVNVRPRGAEKVGDCRTFDGAVQCREIDAADGAVVRVATVPSTEPRWPTLVYVAAWRADGTVVTLLETGGHAPTGQAASPRMLDDDALASIATAAQLKTEWVGPIAGRAPEPSDRRAAELSAVLAAGNILPTGMQAVAVPDARAGALEFFVSQGGYKLSADLVDAAGEGNLFIDLGEGMPDAIQPSCVGRSGCTETTLPGGARATVQIVVQDGVTTITLHAARDGGTQLVLTSRNVSERSMIRAKEAPAPRPTRPQPPLDVDALIRIAVLF